jgi:hypothetical protein
MLKTVHYLSFFKKLHFKKIAIILSLICFIYQSIELTLEYTEFKTTMYVELLKYDEDFSDLPGFSFCTNQLNTGSIDFPKKKFQLIQ